MKNIICALVFVMVQVATAQKSTNFEDSDLIIGLWDDYTTKVDQKNIEGMFNYFKLPLVLHFNEGNAHTINTRQQFDSVYDLWKNSPKSDFHQTERIKIDVTEVFKDFICIADVVYERIDSEGQAVKLERALYHYVDVEGEWKIYMIVNVANGSRSDIRAAQQTRIDERILERAYRRGIIGRSSEHKRSYNKRKNISE